MINENQNLICVDFGNTRIHITGQNERNEQKNVDLSYTDIDDFKNSEALKQIYKLFQSSKIKNIQILYVSVNSQALTKKSLKFITTILKDQLSNKKITLHHVTERKIFKNFPIPKVFDHKTLGADRALKCIFAYQKSKALNKNVLVVSFGTATTCEGFAKDGMMIENFVLPGIQMSFNALHHFTALLPKLNAQKIKVDKTPVFWKQKTYLMRGIVLSLVSTIEKIAKMHAPCIVFLTGGDSKQIKKLFYDFADKNEISKFDLEIIENIETKILVDFHEQFI